MTIKHIFLMVLVWQIVCVIVLGIALRVLPAQKTFLGAGSKIYAQNPWLYSRGNFDGIHYVHIATIGYGYAEQAFFPLYPNLIKKLNEFVNEPYLSGLIISLVSFFVALIFLSKLLLLDYSKKTTQWIILSLMVFPTSFYFGTVYTESLFFLFLISGFYFARKSNWLMAAILGALATYTRFVGIFIFPAFLCEWWSQHQKNWRSPSALGQLICILLIPTGLLLYMNYLLHSTGDSLAFLHSLPLFGSYRSAQVIMLYQVFWRYAKMLWLVPKGTLLYSNVLFEGTIGLLFLILSIYSFVKLRLSYAVFISLAYFAPTLTGSFVSLPRYVLICFPGFIIMGGVLYNNKVIRNLYLIVCMATFVLLLALFSRGYWVA